MTTFFIGYRCLFGPFSFFPQDLHEAEWYVSFSCNIKPVIVVNNLKKSLGETSKTEFALEMWNKLPMYIKSVCSVDTINANLNHSFFVKLLTHYVLLSFYCRFNS